MILRAIVAIFVSLLALDIARAQTAPTLTAPQPISLQRGQAVDVTLTGTSLKTVSSAVVTQDSGLTATLAKSDKPETEAKLTISASADASPGVRELRLVSPTGVSAPVQVWVEQFSLVVDTKPNSDPSNPQPIALPAIITGVIDAPGDSDCYRFTAAKGQTLIFNVIASRLRSTTLDANLILYDAATGRELASNNDTFGADPFLAFEIPADGQYVMEVRDLQYRGQPDFNYRVEAGAIPFVQSLSPTSSRRGSVVDVKAFGLNLAGGNTDTIHLDLTHVLPGRLPLRVKTAAVFSNEVPFEVTELPQTTEAEPNDDAKSATTVSAGTDISGIIAKPGDVDVYRFKLERPTRVLIDAFARRIGSPLDALLTLQDAEGKVIGTNDDAAGADARLGRDLSVGDYLLTVRDLAYAGGPEFEYRVSLQPTLAAPDAPPQDFGLKFQPDTPRVSRGGFAKLWCDVTRLNFPGEVALTVEGLPPGVTVASPTTFAPVNSGIVMLAATPDAPPGVYPITIKATAALGGRVLTRAGQPEDAGKPVQQAYLTVVDAAPFAVQPLATIAPERVQQLSAEINTLGTKILAPSAELDARQAEWEKKVTATTTWTTLDPATFTSEGRADLVKQPDGTILARGATPDTEIYTITTSTDLKNITAIRLECLPDSSLGGRVGPGRAVNGNFVLTNFTVNVAPKSDPGKMTPLAFASARATFAQDQFDAAMAIDDKPMTGWAIAPQFGKPQTAIFLAKGPAGGEGGSALTVTLTQGYGSSHVIGRFRLSATSDANVVDVPPVPEGVLAAAKVPAAERSPQQKALLGIYYRSIDPILAPDIVRLESLRSLLAPQAEIARLEAAINAQTPQLDAEQAQWEQSLANGVGWTPLDASEVRSVAGAGFAKESDGSVFVFGATGPTETYTFVAPTTLKAVTGLRLEALPDPRLPGNGPGRAANGNFILSGLRVSVAPTATPATTQPVEIASGSATFEQDKYPVAHTLDDKPETGWAVSPLFGRPAAAEYFFKTPQGGEGGSILTVTLEHQASAIPMHARLGRFRIAITTAPNPDAAQRIPANILTILKLKAAQRSEPQKVELAAFHRRRARSLQPVRLRLDELKATAPAFPVVIQRGRAGQLPIAITRGPAIQSGDVTVTMEGFTLGRDVNAAGPAPIARSIKVTPLTISGGNVVGALSFTAEQNAEQGTRLVVLRSEAKVGNDTIVQYSPAFPLTVN